MDWSHRSQMIGLIWLCTIAFVHAVPAPQGSDPMTSASSIGAAGGSEAQAPPPPFALPSSYIKVRIAHAVLSSLAWLFFFPLGSILIRTLETSRVVQIHYLVQMTGLYVFVAGAGLGIWMAQTIGVLHRYHPIIGMVLLGCLALQPLTEILNHFFYTKYPKIIYLGYVHIWLGRLLITAGIIQGGLGLVFSASFPSAKPDPTPKIVYGVGAVAVWVLYVSLAIVWPEIKQTFGWWRRKYADEVDDQERSRRRSLAEIALQPAPSEEVYGRN